MKRYLLAFCLIFLLFSCKSTETDIKEEEIQVEEVAVVKSENKKNQVNASVLPFDEKGWAEFEARVKADAKTNGKTQKEESLAVVNTEEQIQESVVEDEEELDKQIATIANTSQEKEAKKLVDIYTEAKPAVTELAEITEIEEIVKPDIFNEEGESALYLINREDETLPSSLFEKQEDIKITREDGSIQGESKAVEKESAIKAEEITKLRDTNTTIIEKPIIKSSLIKDILIYVISALAAIALIAIFIKNVLLEKKKLEDIETLDKIETKGIELPGTEITLRPGQGELDNNDALVEEEEKETTGKQKKWFSKKSKEVKEESIEDKKFKNQYAEIVEKDVKEGFEEIDEIGLGDNITGEERTLILGVFQKNEK